MITGNAVLSLSLSNNTILVQYRTISGTASINLTATGGIASPNIIRDVSAILTTVTNGTLTSPHVATGVVGLSLIGNGTISVPNRINATALLSLTSISSLSVPVTINGGAVLATVSFGSILNSIDLGDLAFSTYGINTTTAGHFVYTAYPFTSFFRIGNSYFATSVSGIYKLDGESSVIWVAKSAQTNCGTEKTKNIPDVYVDMRNSNDVSFSITTDDCVNREGYTICTDDNGGLRRRRVKTHKGLRGNNWQVQASGEGTAEVKQVDCRVSEFKRSIY